MERGVRASTETAPRVEVSATAARLASSPVNRAPYLPSGESEMRTESGAQMETETNGASDRASASVGAPATAAAAAHS